MNKRFKNAFLGALVFGLVGILVTLILNGEPVWNVVIGQSIGGFLLYAYILPFMQSREERKHNR